MGWMVMPHVRCTRRRIKSIKFNTNNQAENFSAFFSKKNKKENKPLLRLSAEPLLLIRRHS
ncbi:MAG: hypothetical protein CO170_03380 [candidate division SR1 bacterium CG_4_9_14_3_um_filter_40_9]|nr:MAG: hypothetical protein CO170_03380 [candidate division SR1 bacterium CG_4_9_14_3_um_filter_40_9]